MHHFIIVGFEIINKGDEPFKFFWTGKRWRDVLKEAKPYKSRKIAEAALTRILATKRWDEESKRCFVEEVFKND